ncbi:hypothetical protein EJB05_34243, partial [Eragrostis curvula]
MESTTGSGAGSKPKKRAAGGPRKKAVPRCITPRVPRRPCIGHYLKKGCYAQCFSTGAPVYLAAVLEYLSSF